MTARGFASLCVKLVAMYYLIQTLAGLATASFFQLFDQASHMGRIYAVVVLGLPALASLGLLWLMRSGDTLARQLVDEDAPLVGVQVAISDLQSVAFSCIGLGLIISGLSEITPIIGYHYVISHFKHAGALLGDMDAVYSNMAGILVRLGCGLFLFLYPGGLISLWTWVQNQRALKNT
jgi:hypothetical protein